MPDDDGSERSVKSKPDFRGNQLVYLTETQSGVTPMLRCTMVCLHECKFLR